MEPGISSLLKPPIGDPCNGCGLCCRAVVCSIGSYALGLVAEYGDRAQGPCPALTTMPDGRQLCGLVARPKDWLPGNPKSATALREAIKLLIGGGMGCDERGDEPDATADSKIDQIVARFLARHSRDEITRAVAVVLSGRPIR